jgi:hypothetical protein
MTPYASEKVRPRRRRHRPAARAGLPKNSALPGARKPSGSGILGTPESPQDISPGPPLTIGARRCESAGCFEVSVTILSSSDRSPRTLCLRHALQLYRTWVRRGTRQNPTLTSRSEPESYPKPISMFEGPVVPSKVSWPNPKVRRPTHATDSRGEGIHEEDE